MLCDKTCNRLKCITPYLTWCFLAYWPKLQSCIIPSKGKHGWHSKVKIHYSSKLVQGRYDWILQSGTLFMLFLSKRPIHQRWSLWGTKYGQCGNVCFNHMIHIILKIHVSSVHLLLARHVIVSSNILWIHFVSFGSSFVFLFLLCFVCFCTFFCLEVFEQTNNKQNHNFRGNKTVHAG